MARAVMVDHPLDELRAGGDVGAWGGLQYYTRTRLDASGGGLATHPPPVGHTAGAPHCPAPAPPRWP